MKYREEGEGCRLPKYVRRKFEGYLKVWSFGAHLSACAGMQRARRALLGCIRRKGRPFFPVREVILASSAIPVFL
jgi:hypothetical protein